MIDPNLPAGGQGAAIAAGRKRDALHRDRSPMRCAPSRAC